MSIFKDELSKFKIEVVKFIKNTITTSRKLLTLPTSKRIKHAKGLLS